jgi:hypothetical protein
MFIKGTDSALFACESRRAESDASRSHVRRIRAITSELLIDPRTPQFVRFVATIDVRIIERANRDSALTEPLTLV